MASKRKQKPMKRAYSYVRFSRAHQIEGDSLRRQTTSTAEYCKRHKLILDDSLNLRDLGVSAFRGGNAKTGALGRFIAACEAGIVPAGAALIVENLDRLSRQTARKTVRLMTELLDDHGIEIHLTMLNKVFRPEVEDGVDLIYAVALAMRANEESETKSKRLNEAFAKKRELAKEGEAKVSSALPWWLTWDKAGKIICPPDRQAVLERIFNDVASGISSQDVARALNAEGTPTWRFKGRKKKEDGTPYGPPIPATVWLDNRVRATIQSDAPLGTITATRKTKKLGKAWKIDNYYPDIISADVAAKARAVILGNRKTGRPCVGVPNLLRGILRHKELWCRFSVHRPQIGGWNGYYEAVDQERRMPWSIAASHLEPILLTTIAELTPETIQPPSGGAAEVSLLRALVKDLETRITNIAAAVEAGSSTMATRLVELEKELVTAKEQFEIAEASSNVAIDTKALTQLSRYALADLKLPEKRTVIAATIRRLVNRIDIGSTLDDLIPKGQDTVLTIEDGDTIVEDAFGDPTGSRGKRPLAILINFHGGGQVAIQRGTEDAPVGGILFTRIFRDGQPIVL